MGGQLGGLEGSGERCMINLISIVSCVPEIIISPPPHIWRFTRKIHEALFIGLLAIIYYIPHSKSAQLDHTKKATGREINIRLTSALSLL